MLIQALRIPPDDFFQIHHVLPRDCYLHTPAFLGQKYSDDMILLELTEIGAHCLTAESPSTAGIRRDNSWRGEVLSRRIEDAFGEFAPD